MATEQTSSNAAIAQTVAEARVAMQAITMAEAERSQNAGLRPGWPIIKPLKFDWNSTDKYIVLRNFWLEVKNMFQNYRIRQTERDPIIKHWLGRQNLQLIESLTQTEQEACNTE